MTADLAALENLFLGLADKTRLRLLGLMAAGPVSVGHLVAETGESQPKISRHLAYLRNAGLVETTRDGKWIYYGIKRLSENASDNVLQCVLGELGGESRASTQKVTSSRRATVAAPTSDLAQAEVEYEPEPWEDEYVDDSPGPVQELEIFLL